MALNFPGPHELRFFYSATVNSVLINHVHRVNLLAGDGSLGLDPGTPFDEIFYLTPAGSSDPATLDTLCDDYALDWAAFMNNTSGIGYAELWEYDDLSFDAHFISTYLISQAGLSATPHVPAGQIMITFRTSLGGVMKLNFMETIIPAGASDTGTIGNADVEDLVSKVEAGTYPWLGRDNGWPFARIGMYPGQNEALFKRRYRNS